MNNNGEWVTLADGDGTLNTLTSFTVTFFSTGNSVYALDRSRDIITWE